MGKVQFIPVAKQFADQQKQQRTSWENEGKQEKLEWASAAISPGHLNAGFLVHNCLVRYPTWNGSQY